MDMPWDHDNLRWSSRGKRSKRPEPEPEPDFDLDEFSAAEALILLANCDGGFCPSFSTAAASNKSSTSPRSSNSTLISHPKKHQEPSFSSILTATSTAVKQKPDSPATPLVPAVTYNNVGDHNCLQCGKRFPSHQALGGHMTSHHRGVKLQTTAVRGRIHECSRCHEQFSTGQALGGHMRKHYDGPLTTRPKAAYCQSISNRIGQDDRGESAEGGATSRVPRPHIDLNMPPAEELDDEEMQFCVISEM